MLQSAVKIKLLCRAGELKTAELGCPGENIPIIKKLFKIKRVIINQKSISERVLTKNILTKQ